MCVRVASTNQIRVKSNFIKSLERRCIEHGTANNNNKSPMPNSKWQMAMNEVIITYGGTMGEVELSEFRAVIALARAIEYIEQMWVIANEPSQVIAQSISVTIERI